VSLLRRMAWAALAGGMAAGLTLSVLQAVWVTPLIRVAERYESPAPAAQPNPAEPAVPPWMPGQGLQRLALSVVSNVLAGVGFALLLAAGMRLRGAALSAQSGLLWGLAGYGAFVLAPALGLPPELPGAALAPLEERQLWWLGTLAATAAGLAVLAFAAVWIKPLGVLLLVLPHAVGAPQAPLDALDVLPPALAGRFVAAVLVTSAVFWAVLGTTCGWVSRRLG
jgi:cobalt transporter subunit CbtA